MKRPLVVACCGAAAVGRRSLAAALLGHLREAGQCVVGVADPLDATGGAAIGPASPDLIGWLVDAVSAARAAAGSAADGPTRLIVAAATPLDLAAQAYAAGADRRLLDTAARAHGIIDLTLLLPAESPSSREEAVEGLLRTTLSAAGWGYAVLHGDAAARLRAALAAIAALQRDARDAGAPRWRHVCAECADPDCERHLFGRGGG